MNATRAISAFITNFGDLAVLLPLVAVITLWLLTQRGLRPALWWVIAAGFCLGGTAFLKIFFYACPPLDDLRSPSGHTSLSTLVYGALAAAIALELRGVQRLLAALAGALLVLAIAFSRVVLEVHTLAEVALGLLLGAASLALFLYPYGTRPMPRAPVRWLVVGAVLVMVLLNGRELRAEDMLHAIGFYLHVAAVCQ